MPTKPYLTTLNTRPFLYSETKRVAELMHAGKTHDEILKIVLEENLFQMKSKDRATRFHSEIQKRLNELDVFLFNQFIMSDTQTSKAILFYAILKKDRLFYEWMREIVWDKFLILDWTLNKNETKTFFEKKSEQSEKVRNWTEETKERLVNAYHQVLSNVEMAMTNEEETQLQPLVISQDVREYLIEKKEKAIVEVLLGELVG